MEKGDIVYYCQVVPNCSIYEILELKLRTIENDYYVGVDEKTKQAQIFTPSMIDVYVFRHRSDALEALKVFRGKNDD